MQENDFSQQNDASQLSDPGKWFRGGGGTNFDLLVWGINKKMTSWEWEINEKELMLYLVVNKI